MSACELRLRLADFRQPQIVEAEIRGQVRLVVTVEERPRVSDVASTP